MVRLTDRPDMTLDVYRGRKTTMQQQQQLIVKRKTRKVSHLWRGEMAVAWQSQRWNRQRNLTVSLRMCSTKRTYPSPPP